MLDPLDWLAERGIKVDLVPVDRDGRVDLEAYTELVTTDAESVAAVSLMWANNEVGTVQPIASLAAVAREHGIPFHTDAVQAVGQVPVDFAASGVDALTLTAHKLGGPYGVGALVAVRSLEMGGRTLLWEKPEWRGTDWIGPALESGPASPFTATDERLWALAAALRRDLDMMTLSVRTGVDPWFLERIKSIIAMERRLLNEPLTPDLLREAKRGLHRRALEDDVGAVASRGEELRDGDAERHEDRRGDAEGLRTECDTLRVVAR